MRALFVALLALVLAPAAAQAQSFNPSFSVQAAAGPTLVESGYTVSVAAGYSPWSRVTFLLDVQRTQQNPRITRTDTPEYSSVSTFRGGTMTAVSGEARVGLFPASRWTPYVMAGFGRGISHPTVNQDFPTRVENQTRFIFFGGGVHVPVREHLSFFGDLRLLVGAEGTHADGLLAMCPVRIGMAWRF
jgi:opacity protein-like surface antigen